MAQKKKAEGGATSLQIEVETEMQWRTLLRREGLIGTNCDHLCLASYATISFMYLFITVVDVYASWAGPCISMVSILKRIKIEVNDERLWYAVVSPRPSWFNLTTFFRTQSCFLSQACSDEISDLLMFKDQSEPCWLFLGVSYFYE